MNDAFDHAKDTIMTLAGSTVELIGEMGQRAACPDQMEIKFGLKFTAKGSVVVAEASGEATLEVRLLYTAASDTGRGGGPGGGG